MSHAGGINTSPEVMILRKGHIKHAWTHIWRSVDKQTLVQQRICHHGNRTTSAQQARSPLIWWFHVFSIFIWVTVAVVLSVWIMIISLTQLADNFAFLRNKSLNFILPENKRNIVWHLGDDLDLRIFYIYLDWNKTQSWVQRNTGSESCDTTSSAAAASQSPRIPAVWRHSFRLFLYWARRRSEELWVLSHQPLQHNAVHYSHSAEIYHVFYTHTHTHTGNLPLRSFVKLTHK